MARANTAKWKTLRKTFLSDLTDHTCYLCGDEVDMTLGGNHALGPQVDHIRSVQDHPELEYDVKNCALVHKRCNQGKWSKPLADVNVADLKMRVKHVGSTPDGRWYCRYDNIYGWVRVGCGTVAWSGEEILITFKDGRALV